MAAGIATHAMPECADCRHPAGLHRLTEEPPRVRKACSDSKCSCKQYRLVKS